MSRGVINFKAWLFEIAPYWSILDSIAGYCDPIRFRCKTCKTISTKTPKHMRGRPGCKNCAMKSQHILNTRTHEKYVQEVRERRPDVREVLGVYKGNETHIDHLWKCGHVTSITPNNVLNHGRCRKCYHPYRNTSEYREWLADNQPNIVCIGEYKGATTKTTHRCQTCSLTWEVMPMSVKVSAQIKTLGCPACARAKGPGISQAGTRWLDQQEKLLRIKIAREVRIDLPDGKYCYVDGINKRKGIIFEYNGSAFHGDPRLYKKDDRCHPFNREVTAGELLKATRTRERKLRRMGYTIISVWSG